jgi:hypothetical protein
MMVYTVRMSGEMRMSASPSVAEASTTMTLRPVKYSSWSVQPINTARSALIYKRIHRV